MKDVSNMNRDPKHIRLLEAAWRGELAAGEKTELRQLLAAHPELREEWARERALNQALGSLADAPVASNFTARVMQSIGRTGESPVYTGSRARRVLGHLLGWGTRDPRDGDSRGLFPPRDVPVWRAWVPRLGMAAVLVISGLASYQHFESAERTQLAQSVATVSEITALPPDVLRDFDAIQALSSNPVADEQLLAVMSVPR